MIIEEEKQHVDYHILMVKIIKRIRAPDNTVSGN